MLKTYAGIFLDAAVPQKLVFLLLAAAAIAAVAITLNRMRQPAPPSALIGAQRLACPALGLLCAALNAVHMMQTTMRLPLAPTAKMLAPGFLEMSALVEAGALAGLVAVVLNWALEARLGRRALSS